MAQKRQVRVGSQWMYARDAEKALGEALRVMKEEEGHEHHESFITKYVFSQDHKWIGIQYGFTALCFLLFGFFLMIMMRLQLGWPGDSFWIIKQFFHGTGCNFCAGTGYRDRIGVYELLRITPELRRLIVGWATTEELRRLAVAQGMRTMLREGMALVENDITTVPEVIKTLYAS